MPMRKDRAKRDEEAAFARRVVELYHAALEGTSNNHLEDDRDVRTVAFGLAAITQALNDRKAKYGQFRLVEGGVPHGFDVMDGIMRGFAHPVWKFIDGIRHYKGGRPAAGEASIRLRELFAGLTLAYCQAAGVNETAARAKVANGVTWEDHRFSEGQIKGWIRYNRPAAERLSQHFLADAAGLPPSHSLADRVLGVGREAIFHSSATVPAARQKPKS
jgi:hypothetical protein